MYGHWQPTYAYPGWCRLRFDLLALRSYLILPVGIFFVLVGLLIVAVSCFWIVATSQPNCCLYVLYESVFGASLSVKMPVFLFSLFDFVIKLVTISFAWITSWASWVLLSNPQVPWNRVHLLSKATLIKSRAIESHRYCMKKKRDM